MKCIHLGDLHLGKRVNEFSMIEDQRYILNQIIEIIRNESVGCVLMAGDIYDRSVPSEEAVKLFDAFLTELSGMGTTVLIISGNHDSEERLQFGSKLFQANHIHIAARYDGKVTCVDLQDAYGAVHFWLLPYVKASRVAHFFPDETIDTYDDAVKTALGSCGVDREERNVLLTHQYVSGSLRETRLAGSETAVDSVGTIDRISADCFADFDYVAMGHIHSAQAVGRDTCRYAGAPLKYSLKEQEINGRKTVPVITLSEKGTVEVELFDLKPRREIRHIRGPLQELIQHAEDTEDYIYATLTDEATQFDAMARIREVYPNTMKLDYDNATTRALQQSDQHTETKEKSFEEMISGFFLAVYGKEPSEEEWEILQEAAKEAGVIE